MWKWEPDGEAKGVIVMVHGALEHHRRYGWLIEMWRQAGFQVIMGDLPGHGMTTRSKRGHIDSFDDYLDEVKAWVETAYQFDLPVFLLGHSMGGLITIRLLQEENLNLAGVILSSPCLALVNRPGKILNGISYLLNVIAPELRLNSGISVDIATRNKEILDIDRNDTLYIDKISIRWFRELDASMKLAFEELQKVKDVPMLVMQAGDDKIVNKQAVTEWFNHAPLSEKRFKEWPKCYHEIFNDPERDEVFEYAKDFVYSQLKAIGYVV
ncbi:alpha/beta hydrolase [Robertmurraya andreesenii]|uniref:Lysophospholipase n=1 Tax=Anoxybacillus andreesenii TaxID=1325932 RepID=A0ABT9V6N5_9BACL|nr:alpha/beta hydrolase [Robertmurraya andreesenii]MDQ0156608.1 lysophospholipase [Robertmurraya andreesenii]